MLSAAGNNRGADCRPARIDKLLSPAADRAAARRAREKETLRAGGVDGGADRQTVDRLKATALYCGVDRRGPGIDVLKAGVAAQRRVACGAPRKQDLEPAAAHECSAREAAPRNDLHAAAEDFGADGLAGAADFQKAAGGYRRGTGDAAGRDDLRPPAHERGTDSLAAAPDLLDARV
jgi:hypothetical protein